MFRSVLLRSSYVLCYALCYVPFCIHVTVQPGWFCNLDNSQGMSIPDASSRLPAHPNIHPLSTYISTPPRAGKQQIGVCFVRAGNAVSKQGKMERMATVRGAEDHNAVSKQPKMKMMLTVKANPKFLMLHQIGRKSRWCQQNPKGIKECCWHQRRILPRWCSISSRLPSHHHKKASKRYSIGMPGAKIIFMSGRHCMDFTSAGMWLKAGIGFFANLLYAARMPLNLFTVSSPGESMTLSPITLAQQNPSEISIFDAIQPISEAVTLYLPQLFFCKRPSVRALMPILNVTEFDISYSVK